MSSEEIVQEILREIDFVGVGLKRSVKLLERAHAVMVRCHWNEPTGLEGDEDSALQVERDVREFLGK